MDSRWNATRTPYWDVPLIETNESQGGRRTKFSVPVISNTPGVSPMRERIHEGMARGAIGAQKNDCERTRERTASSQVNTAQQTGDRNGHTKNGAHAFDEKRTQNPGRNPLDNQNSFRDKPPALSPSSFAPIVWRFTDWLLECTQLID